MNRLKELRQSKGLKQEDIAKFLGVSTMTISRWEKNNADIKFTKAKLLAEYFDVTVPYLLGDSEIPNIILMEAEDSIYDEKFLQRIIAVLGEKFIEKLGENYILDRYSDNVDYSNLGPLRNAVISLTHSQEEELLLHFAVLSKENKTIILNLIKSLAHNSL